MKFRRIAFDVIPCNNPDLKSFSSFPHFFGFKEVEEDLFRHLVISRLAFPNQTTRGLTAELNHNMYQINYSLPISKHTKTMLLKMDEKQQELYDII